MTMQRFVESFLTITLECLVTDESIKLLAKACRNLKKISLPGSRSSELGDQGLIHLISFCQNLTHLEFSGSGVTEVTLEQWIAHPDWAPNLKKLRLNDLSYNRKPMRALREFGRTRPTLPIELVTRSQFKKWDTWYLETSHDTYKNGRKVSSSLPTVT